MDRCHRIGQHKPVLVFRLATAASVEDKMLARAASKLALERLVMKKGAFKELVDQGKAKHAGMTSGLGVDELMDLLQTVRPHSAQRTTALRGWTGFHLLVVWQPRMLTNWERRLAAHCCTAGLDGLSLVGGLAATNIDNLGRKSGRKYARGDTCLKTC